MFNKFSITKNQRKEYFALAIILFLTFYIPIGMQADIQNGNVNLGSGIIGAVFLWWIITHAIKRYRRLHEENTKEGDKKYAHDNKLIRPNSLDGVLGIMHDDATY